MIVGNSNSDDGSQTFEVWKDRTGKIHKGNDALTVSTGNQDTEISKGNQSTKISMGNQEIKITAGYGKTEAGKYIELKVGGSSIKLEPTKITLKSVQIVVQGDATVTAKAPMAKVLGDAMLQLMGGMVQIN